METEEIKNEKGVMRAIRDFFDVMRDLWKILSWWETHIPTLIALAIFGWWGCFAFAHTLPHPLRGIVIWTLIIGLVIVAPGALFLSGRR